MHNYKCMQHLFTIKTLQKLFLKPFTFSESYGQNVGIEGHVLWPTVYYLIIRCLCGTVFLLLYGDRRWHCALSSDNSRPICFTSDVSTNRRNIHHRQTLLWSFSWFWRRMQKCRLTYTRLHYIWQGAQQLSCRKTIFCTEPYSLIGRCCKSDC